MTHWASPLLKKNKVTQTKYGNKKPKCETGMCASGLEHDLHIQLLWQVKAEEISELRQQVHVPLTKAKIVYIADFCFKNKANEIEYAEAKGFSTDIWRIKRRLWMHYGPGKLSVYKGRVNSYLKLDEEIYPRSNESEL